MLPVAKRNRSPMTLGELERDFTEWFRGMFPAEREGLFSSDLLPVTNVSETENEFEVSLELPGVKAEDFQVELRDGDLWIQGEKRQEHEDTKEEKGRVWHTSERHYGAFRRVIPLPPTADPKKVEAVHEDGVLKVTIAKQPGNGTKSIRVKTPK